MGVSHQRPLLCSRWMCPIWSEKRRKSTAHQTCSPLQKPPSQGPAVLSLFPHPESPHPFKAPTESFCKAVPPQPSMCASQDIHLAAPCTKSLEVPEGKSPLHFKGKKDVLTADTGREYWRLLREAWPQRARKNTSRPLALGMNKVCPSYGPPIP